MTCCYTVTSGEFEEGQFRWFDQFVDVLQFWKIRVYNQHTKFNEGTQNENVLEWESILNVVSNMQNKQNVSHDEFCNTGVMSLIQIW